MNCIFRTAGESISYTNSTASDIAAGTIVNVGSLYGIVRNTIHAGETGTLFLEGDYSDVPKKADTTGYDITKGQKLYYNPVDGKVYPAAAAGYVMIGYAVSAAASAKTTCRLLLKPECTPPDSDTLQIPTLEYTAASDIAAGTLVAVGALVGIADTAIANGAKGTLRLVGTCKNVTKNGSGALMAGQVVYFNPANSKIYAASAEGYIPCGYALAAAGSSATSCDILLVPGANVAVPAGTL